MWSFRRLKTIVAMNIGRYEPYLEPYGRVQMTLDDAGRADEADPKVGTVRMSYKGLQVVLAEPRHADRIELAISRNDDYEVELMLHQREVAKMSLPQIFVGNGDLATHVLPVPAGTNFDAIRILPRGGDGVYGFGHVRLS